METIIELKNVKKTFFPHQKDAVFAVNDVSLAVKKGEILGLVGESGCGKSTLGKLMLNLEKVSDGKIFFQNQDITNFDFEKMRAIRKDMQMVFQNSIDSFNPYLTVKQIVLEPLDNYLDCSNQKKDKLVNSMLEQVGLNDEYLQRYVIELSGGQRQRVGIARALILNPAFVVCDEAVSALDYAVRNKILKLLYKLKKEKNLTYLFISHDLSAISQICTRVVVMYMGQILEILPNLKNDNIHHPYTKALMGASLGTDPKNRSTRKVLFKEDESDEDFSHGCPFYPRCFYANNFCKCTRPTLKEIDDRDHFVACHYPLDNDAK